MRSSKKLFSVIFSKESVAHPVFIFFLIFNKREYLGLKDYILPKGSFTNYMRDYAGKDWGQEEREITEDEMVGWHHWLYGHELQQALGVGDGQGSLACCSPWCSKESDITEQQNWTNTYIPFLLRLPSSHQSHPSRSLQSTGLSFLCHTPLC